MRLKHLFSANKLFSFVLKGNELSNFSTPFLNFLKSIDLENDEYFFGEVTNNRINKNSEVPFKEGSYAFIYKTQQVKSASLIIDQDLRIKQYFESVNEKEIFNIERTFHYEPEYNALNIFGTIIIVLPPNIKEEISQLGISEQLLDNVRL